jgi:DNA-binding SARP family transcriptional activator
MLQVCMFGSLSVSSCASTDVPSSISLPGRLAMMFAYLALARGHYFQRRDLMEALWSDRSESATAGMFNTTLWRLRRALETAQLQAGEVIAAGRRGPIGLHRGAAMQVDLESFTQLIAPGLNKPLEQLSVDDVDGLRRGVALYKADVLTDFTEEWALREREKYRRSYLNALGRLMQFNSVRGDYTSAIRCAQAVLDCDALREDVHRELMRLFACNGQRALGLRQFEVCRALLKSELGIAPMRDTVILYREIANGALAPVHLRPIDAALDSVARCQAAEPATGDESVRDLLNAAHQHLLLAEQRVQLSLQLLER